MTALRSSGVALVAALAALAGCQALLDTGVAQCDVDGDCAARGPAFAGMRCINHDCALPPADVPEAGTADVAPPDPKWGCVGNVKWAPQSTSEKVVRRVRVIRVLGSSPLEGALSEACTRYDTAVGVDTMAASYCAAPLSSSTSDTDGYSSLPVPRGFDGYVATHPPPSFPSMVPTLAFWFPPLATNDPLEIAPEDGLLVLSKGELSALVSQVSTKPVDPTLGHVFVGAADCNNDPADGVALSISNRADSTVPFYDSSGLPSANLTETGADGRGGFVNVPPGAVTVEGRRNGVKIASFTILVRAGFVTYLRLVPSPL